MTDDNGWTKVEQANSEEWDYKTIPELVGVLTAKDENVGPNNSKLYRFETKDGKAMGAWGSNVLDGKMKAVEVGEEVRLVYLGKKTSEKTGRSYHDFDVFHRPMPMKKV